MTGRDAELFKEKVEITLHGRQIFYLFFGGAVIAAMVFVLGVMVGRRVEARSAQMGSEESAVRDPLAALDQLQGGSVSELAFPSALRGGDESLGPVDEQLSRSARRAAAAPAPDPRQADSGEATGTDKAAPEEPEPAAKKAERAVEKHAAEKKDGERSDDGPEDAVERPAESKQPAPEPAAVDRSPDDDGAQADRARFTLQIGSFQDRAEADTLAAELQRAGYDPYVLSADVPDKGTWYRVRVGRYPNYKEALSAKAEFEGAQKVIAYVTRL